MEEYHQITLNEWLDMKDQLRRELNNVRQSYIRVGYVLRRMEETRAYEAEGYKSVAEFAEREHGLKPSTTSRWMAINREYSLDGYSMQLDPRYLDMNASQLTEMLGLPMEDREMIRPETKREDIRELKRMEKEPEADSDLAQIVRMFFEAFPDVLMEVRELEGRGAGQEKLVEAVAPSGSRAFRKNGMMLMMYEDSVKFKAAGHSPVTVDWSEIFGIAAGIEEEMTKEGTDEEEEGADRTAADEERPEEAGTEAPEGSGEEGPSGQGMDDERGAEEEHGTEGDEEDSEGSGIDAERSEGGGADDGEGGEGPKESDTGRSSGAGPEEAGSAGTVAESEVPEAEDDEDGPEASGDVPEVSDDLIAPAQIVPEGRETQRGTDVEKIVDESGNPAPEEGEQEGKTTDWATIARDREICWKNLESLMNLFNRHETEKAVNQCRFVLKCLEALLKEEKKNR